MYKYLVPLFAVVSASMGSTTLVNVPQSKYNSQVDDQGNFNFQCFRLNDPGFQREGEALGNKTTLQTVAFLRDDSGQFRSSDESVATGVVWLAVSTRKKDLTSVVTHSTKAVNTSMVAQGEYVEWPFDGKVQLDTNTLYYYQLYQDNGDGEFRTDGSDVLVKERFAVTEDSVDGYCFENNKLDMYIKISLGNPVKEREVLLGINGVSIGISVH